MNTLEKLEKTAVIIAALAALVPIYQYYSEKELRVVEMRAIYASAVAACLDHEEVKKYRKAKQSHIQRACWDLFNAREWSVVDDPTLGNPRQ